VVQVFMSLKSDSVKAVVLPLIVLGPIRLRSIRSVVGAALPPLNPRNGASENTGKFRTKLGWPVFEQALLSLC
jgi:hypothetical protein